MYSTPPVSENHETIRLTVADILSTMANSVDAMTPTTVSAPNLTNQMEFRLVICTFGSCHCWTDSLVSQQGPPRL